MIPGWPYSLVVALERGRTSWTLPLDAVRLRPEDDLAAVTAAQVRDVVTRLIAAGHWKDGDPDIMVIFDAGYGPVSPGCCATSRCRSPAGFGANRVFRLPPLPRHQPGGARQAGEARRGAAARRGRCPAREPDAVTTTVTSRYGAAVALSWNRAHPRLKARGAWEGHQGALPVIEGTLHPAHRQLPAP